MPRDTNFLAPDADAATDASSGKHPGRLAQRLGSSAVFLFCYCYYAAAVFLLGYGVKSLLVAFAR